MDSQFAHYVNISHPLKSIYRSWQQWEIEQNDDSNDSIEEDFIQYRKTVASETPSFNVDADIKSGVSSLTSEWPIDKAIRF